MRELHSVGRRAVLAGAVGLASSSLAGCASPAQIRQYEFAVTLRVAGRVITRSVVQQFLFRERVGGIVAPGSSHWSPEGEALAIPLGSGLGVVVSTFRKLGGEFPSTQPFFNGKYLDTEGWGPLAPLVRAQLPDGGAGLGRFEQWQAVLSLPAPSEWVVSMPDELPLFVRFTDAADPASAVWVNPEGTGGPVTFVRAATRLTNARLTSGPLTEALPWLADLGSTGRPFLVVPGGELKSVSQLLSQYDLRQKPHR